MSTDGTELTPKQRLAVAALLTEPSNQAAAAACGVSARTLWRWQQQPAFVDALRAAERGAIDQASRRLATAAGTAITVLTDVLNSPTAAPGIKVRAAECVLMAVLKIRELASLEQRVAVLEMLIHGEGERVE